MDSSKQKALSDRLKELAAAAAERLADLKNQLTDAAEALRKELAKGGYRHPRDPHWLPWTPEEAFLVRTGNRKPFRGMVTTMADRNADTMARTIRDLERDLRAVDCALVRAVEAQTFAEGIDPDRKDPDKVYVSPYRPGSPNYEYLLRNTAKEFETFLANPLPKLSAAGEEVVKTTRQRTAPKAVGVTNSRPQSSAAFPTGETRHQLARKRRRARTERKEQRSNA